MANISEGMDEYVHLHNKDEDCSKSFGV